MLDVSLMVIVSSAAMAGTPMWEPGPAMPVSVTERVHAFGLNVNGSLYAIGGPPWRNPGDDDGSVHRLSVGASTWTELPALDGLGPFVFQGGGVDALGRIMVFGGELISDPEEGPQSPFVYDPIEGPSGGLADRSESAAYARFGWCTDDQGRIYSLGGGPGAGGSNGTHCERYDGNTDSWEVIAPMVSGVADAATACDGSRILVFGGFDATGSSRSTNVALYDIATDTWSDTAVPDLPVGVSGARAVVGSDGRFYVLGGAVGPVGSGSVQSDVWVLEADLSAWVAGPSMAEPRQWFAAVLGDDHYIYVVGGDNDSGGTIGVEKMETIPCPTFVQLPADQQAWAGSVAGFSAEAEGGGTIVYQWSKDGIALTDGPTGTGSEIVGAMTESVGILNPSDADEGSYSVMASNSCGETVAMVAGELTVSEPMPLEAGWEVVNLHPSWANSSKAQAIDDGITGGSVVAPEPTYGALSQAVVWMGDSGAAINLTPGNSVGSEALDFANGVAVGWYWRPYGCQGGQTCYFKVAAKWTWNGGTSWGFTDIHSFPEYDYARGTDGTTHVGVNWSDEPPYTSRRIAWLPNGSKVTMDGTGYAVDDGVAFGAASVGSTAIASRWTFLPTRRFLMGPVSSTNSYIYGAGTDQQVGTATVDGMTRGWLWAGSSGGSVDLTPSGADSATLYDCEQGLQVGISRTGTVTEATIWSGGSETATSLHAYLPAGYSYSYAQGIDVDPTDGTVRVVGYGYDPSVGHTEALMWINVPLSCPGDANGDGTVDFEDLNIMLANWNSTGPDGDVDGSGFVDFDDLNVILANWAASCL